MSFSNQYQAPFRKDPRLAAQFDLETDFPKKLRNGRPPVILQVIPELGAGGAEQGCIDVSNAIIDAGGLSIVVSNGGNRVHEITRKGAIHIDMPVHSKNPLTMWKNTRRLRKIIRDQHVSLIHARSRAPAWSCYYAAKAERIPFVTTCHAAYKFKSNLKRSYNSVMAKGERVISISNFISGYLQESYGLHASRIRRAYRGIILEKFHPNLVTPERMMKVSEEWRVPDGAPVVLMPGRISRIKGHHFMIDAMVRLREKFNRDDVFCVFVGSDQGRKEYRQEIENTIKEKGLEGRIRIVNHCSDMPSAYMLSSVVVCASMVPEGFGRVPVESQAMGRPSIATSHGATGETIIPGKTGWLVEPGNVDELADALNEALSLTDEQRAVLATTSMVHVAENFTVQNMCKIVLDTYAELLS